MTGAARDHDDVPASGPIKLSSTEQAPVVTVGGLGTLTAKAFGEIRAVAAATATAIHPTTDALADLRQQVLDLTTRLEAFETKDASSDDRDERDERRSKIGLWLQLGSTVIQLATLARLVTLDVVAEPASPSAQTSVSQQVDVQQVETIARIVANELHRLEQQDNPPEPR